MIAIWYLRADFQNNGSDKAVRKAGIVTTKSPTSLPDVAKLEESLDVGKITAVRSIKLLVEFDGDNVDFVSAT